MGQSQEKTLEFVVGDHVGVIRFGCSGKLSPRYIGSFDIIEWVREVAYQVALPPALDGVDDVFHISQLRKYVRDD